MISYLIGVFFFLEKASSFEYRGNRFLRLHWQLYFEKQCQELNLLSGRQKLVRSEDIIEELLPPAHCTAPCENVTAACAQLHLQKLQRLSSSC